MGSEIKVIPTPQGRNSTPNRDYKPVGATFDSEQGQRCEGNANCVPICPVQAKYNALKSLCSAKKDNLKVIYQAVASKIEIDPASGRVTGITYKRYTDPKCPTHTTHVARGKYYVIAAHAVESAKLLLASQITDKSDQLGRHLMDHSVLLAWGLMPENAGSFRGPGSTSNIPTFRDGAFRRKHSAWIMPIDNWGWSWPEFAPGSTVETAINSMNMFGKSLRRYIYAQVPRQMNFHFEFELLPDPANRVTIDVNYRDQLGNFRPVVRFNVPDYTREAMEVARDISKQVFARLGIQDHTQYNLTDPGYVVYNGTGYTFRGAGHLAGTHRMGFSKSDSVTDRTLRTWGHDNLYVVGPGSMPTIGTSNPTLTVAALTFLAADNILNALK
jgi:choline dehydrogenase-like flavoprotein